MNVFRVKFVLKYCLCLVDRALTILKILSSAKVMVMSKILKHFKNIRMYECRVVVCGKIKYSSYFIDCLGDSHYCSG